MAIVADPQVDDVEAIGQRRRISAGGGATAARDAVQALADDLAEREDKLDLLVNNAGAAWGEPFEHFKVI